MAEVAEQSTEDWSRFDMNSLLFLGEEHLAEYDADQLPPPGMSTSSLVVVVAPEGLAGGVREAARPRRTVGEVVQSRLRHPAA